MSCWQYRHGNVLHRKCARVVRLFRQPRVQIPGGQGIAYCSKLLWIHVQLVRRVRGIRLRQIHKSRTERIRGTTCVTIGNTENNHSVCKRTPISCSWKSRFKHSRTVVRAKDQGRNKRYRNSTCTGQVELSGTSIMRQHLVREGTRHLEGQMASGAN